jgi:hypothetical protein
VNSKIAAVVLAIGLGITGVAGVACAAQPQYEYDD